MNEQVKNTAPAGTEGSAREQLLRMARENIEMVKSDTLRLADEIMQVPAHHYYDAERWQQLAELGWLSLPFAEADGGFGGGPLDLSCFRVCRHLLREKLPGCHLHQDRRDRSLCVLAYMYPVSYHLPVNKSV